MSTRIDRLDHRRRVATGPGSVRTPSRVTTSWSRPARSGESRTSLPTPPTWTRRSSSSTRASTNVRPRSPAGPVLVVGASHSGCDIAFELAQRLPTTLVGRALRPDPLPLGSQAHQVRLSGGRLRVAARAHPAHAHGSQGAGPGPAPRRANAAGQARASRRRAASNESHSGWPASKDGVPLLDDGRVIRASTVDLVHRLPAGLRLDQGPDLRCGWMARGVPGCRRAGSRDCSSAASPSSSPSAPWCCWAWDATRSTSRDGSRRGPSLCRSPDGPHPARPKIHERVMRNGRRRRSGTGRERRTNAASGSLRTTPSPMSTTPRSAPRTSPRLAMAAYLLGRKNDCIQALQRAYQAHIDAGEIPAAVRAGFWLAMVLLTQWRDGRRRRVGGALPAASGASPRRRGGARLRAGPRDDAPHLRRRV